MFGHDAAGLVFGQNYTASGKALLDAAASAVSACRRVGFGIQTSASNYGHANASSTVGGGTSPVPPPTAPAVFSAPAMPPPLGSGVAQPALWSLVEAFVGDVWPDGNPGQMHAAAGAWRQFGAAVGGLAVQLTASGPGLSAQQIPEAGQMVSALGQICSGLGDIAGQAQAMASAVDGFANAVDATQNAVRSLLHQLSPVGVLETIGGIFSGHNPIDEIRKVASEIKTVLDNMKREADATGGIVTQGINLLDSATNSLEAWANKEFTSALGREVGGVLSSDFNAFVDLPEGGLKFVAETAQGISQLDPSRFAYDPAGAAKTWEGMLETTTVMLNPALLAGEVASDPSGSLDTVKGLVDWKDVEAGHPFRAVGYDTAQVASAFIPGVGEAKPAIVASQVEGRVAATSAEVEGGAVAGVTRETVPGLAAGTSASENITAAAGRAGTELNAVKVPESTMPGAAHGEASPVGRAPVDTVPTHAETPSGRAPVDAPPAVPRMETPAPAVEPAHVPEPRVAEVPPSPHVESTAPPTSHVPEPATVPSGGSYESVPAAGEAAPAASGGHGFDAPVGGADDRVPVSVGAHSAESTEGIGGHAGHGPGGGSSETPSGGSGHGSDHVGGHGDHHSAGSAGDHDGHDSHPSDGHGGHDEGSAPDGGLSDEKRDEIRAMEHGSRPDPADYLSQEYIDHHLARFDHGATRFMPESNFDKYGLAQRDGTSFVMATDEIDALVDATKGDPRAMERALGWPEGFLDNHRVIRIDIPEPQNYDLRIPSGNEAGANDLWIPGGLLPDGLSEAVVDGSAINSGDYTISEFDE